MAAPDELLWLQMYMLPESTRFSVRRGLRLDKPALDAGRLLHAAVSIPRRTSSTPPSTARAAASKVQAAVCLALP